MSIVSEDFMTRTTRPENPRVNSVFLFGCDFLTGEYMNWTLCPGSLTEVSISW